MQRGLLCKTLVFCQNLTADVWAPPPWLQLVAMIMSEVQALAQLDGPNFQYQFINIILRVQDMLRASTVEDSVRSGLSPKPYHPT